MSTTIAAYDHITPSRPSHRLSRSITEISIPQRKSRPHRSHHHQQPHQIITSSHRARSSEKDRGRESELQSAHPNLQSFLGGETRWRDGIRTDHGTPAESINASRRQSAFDIDGAGKGIDGAFMNDKRRSVKESELKEAREKGLLMEKELRDSLITLHTQSNDASRRLDSTYYSVLEKLSILNASISSLKDLANSARHVNLDFQTESAELAADVSAQLENFSNFTAQESRIQELAQRVHAGRTKMVSLGERAEAVRKRVESWERAEGEWQEKTRKRLRIMWIVISVVGGLIFGLVVFRYTPARTTHGPGVFHGFNASELNGRVPGGENFTFSLQREKGERGSMLERIKEGQKTDAEEDPRLRVFDEL